MTLEDFVVRALLVPFVPKGASWEGWDCWGVCVMAYRELLGVEIPTHEDRYRPRDVLGTTALADLVRERIPHWKEVENPEPMDVAVFFWNNRPVHVGLVIDHRRVLHSEKKRGTFVATIGSSVLGFRLEGVYRHVG